MTWSKLQTWDQGLNYESYGDKLTNTKKCLGNHITGRSGWSLNTTFAIKLRKPLITWHTKRYNGPRGGSEMHFERMQSGPVVKCHYLQTKSRQATRSGSEVHFEKNAVWPPRRNAIIHKRDHDKQQVKMQQSPLWSGCSQLGYPVTQALIKRGKYLARESVE